MIISKEVEFDVDLESFDDDDIRYEFENRGLNVTDLKTERTLELIQEIYDAKTRGNSIDALLVDLFDVSIGRIA